jgi:glycosyltransferase involved in cell wall biosynthesis
MSEIIKPVLVIQAPLFTQSGYGLRSLDLAKSILRMDKYDIKVVPTRWGSTPQINLEEASKADDEIRILLSKILTASLTEQPDVFVQVSIPSEAITPAKYNVLFTAGIETTLPRGEWIEGINKMDLTIVSSQFAKDVFMKTVYKRKDQNTGAETDLKVTKPIEVLFEGVDVTKFFKTDVTSVSELDNVPESFAYLFVGHWLGGDIGHDRKDVGGLVRTFSETFKNIDNPPALILKTSCGNNSYMDQQEVLKRVISAREGIIGTLPNVYVIHGELTDTDMNNLYNHSKVKAHVSFTHGEGYGRPLIEASMSGKPVVAPNWSGHLDFLNKDKSVLLRGSVKPVHASSVNDWIIKESGWFYVNYQEANITLKDIFYNYDKYSDKCSGLSEENKEKFSMDKMSEKLKEIFDKNIPEFAVKAKLVLPKLKRIGGLNKQS